MSTKQKVLQVLEENRGRDLSGQDMADQLQISRTSVWKAIQTLRQEGYPIDAAPNKGYLLRGEADILSAEAIRLHLNNERAKMEVQVFKSIDSTNAEAKRRLQAGNAEDMLLLSEEQTAGRGRLNRAFFSPQSSGLYMSLILPTVLPSSDPGLLTTAAAVAVCRAIEKVTGLSPQIKWVNDLFLDGRKICGILTEGVMDFETQTIQSIVIGIGINVYVEEEKVPLELRDIVGGLYRNEQTTVHSLRNELAAEIVNQFYHLYPGEGTPTYLDEYRERCFVLGKTVSFTRNGSICVGTALTVDDRGGLVIRLGNGEVTTISYGEISIKLAE